MKILSLCFRLLFALIVVECKQDVHFIIAYKRPLFMIGNNESRDDQLQQSAWHECMTLAQLSTIGLMIDQRARARSRRKKERVEQERCDVYIVKMLSEKITLIISAWADTIYYLFRFKKLKNRFSLFFIFFTPWTPTRIFNENLLGFDFSSLSLSFAYFQMTFHSSAVACWLGWRGNIDRVVCL